MPERFETYIVYKRRYMKYSSFPFLSFLGCLCTMLYNSSMQCALRTNYGVDEGIIRLYSVNVRSSAVDMLLSSIEECSR